MVEASTGARPYSKGFQSLIDGHFTGHLRRSLPTGVATRPDAPPPPLFVGCGEQGRAGLRGRLVLLGKSDGLDTNERMLRRPERPSL